MKEFANAGQEMLDDEVLTADEAAHLLKVSSKTLLKLARDGELHGQKVGRAWRFRRSVLLAYVDGPLSVDEVAS